MRYKSTASILLVLLSLGIAVPARGANWNVANGGNWSTGWDTNPVYPKLAGDTGVISLAAPAWTTSGNVTVNVADITGGTYSISDANASAGATILFNNNATFDSLSIATTSATPSGFNVASGVTFKVTSLQWTGHQAGVTLASTSTVQFVPNGSGVSTFSFVLNTAVPQMFLGAGSTTIDFSESTTVNWSSLAGSTSSTAQSRGSVWKFGSTTTNQVVNFTNGVSSANLTLMYRNDGPNFDLVKVGGNDVTFNNVAINRRGFGNRAIPTLKLFTTAAGGQAGGTVTLSNYLMPSFDNTISGAEGAVQVATDNLGANLTIASGGSFLMNDSINPGANSNDVTAFRILPGNTLRVLGAGGITISDATVATPFNGRMGIHFPGSTLDSDANFSLLGPATFLNDAGNTASVIRVGGNLTVESRNASGFAALTGGPVAGDSFDDFDLRATDLFMDGGGARTLDWDTGAALGGPVMTAGDFSLSNFTVDSLTITNNTALTFLPGQSLFLDDNFTIDPGSTLTLGLGSRIFILDPDQSEFARLTGYNGSRILNGKAVLVPGVGVFLTIPEPAAAALLLAPLAVLLRRRRP